MTGLSWAAIVATVVVVVIAFICAADANPIGTGASALAILAMRLVLVGTGFVFSPTWVRSLDVLVGVSFLLLAASLRTALGSAGATADQRVALMASLLALPVASVAAAQLLAPVAPQVGGIVTCAGGPVAGSRMQARTGEFGLNARSGPGTTYAPEGRFDASCVVGVDGYCVGEAVRDVVVPLPDVRWLRIRHSTRYVSAGTLFTLSPEARLGQSPEPDCPEGQPDPVLAGPLSFRRTDRDHLTIEALPQRTTLVGFGLFYEGSSPEKVEQLGRAPKLAKEATGRVSVQLSLSGTRAASKARFVDLAVVPCLAPVVPSHRGQRLLRVDLGTGRVRTLDDVSDDRLSRLRQAACRIDPSANNDEIAAAATE